MQPDDWDLKSIILKSSDLHRFQPDLAPRNQSVIRNCCKLSLCIFTSCFHIKRPENGTQSSQALTPRSASQLATRQCWALVLPLTPIGSLPLLLTGPAGRQKIWLVCFESDREKVHPITFYVFLKGPPSCKCFLWALSRMDMWNQPYWFGRIRNSEHILVKIHYFSRTGWVETTKGTLNHAEHYQTALFSSLNRVTTSNTQSNRSNRWIFCRFSRWTLKKTFVSINLFFCSRCQAGLHLSEAERQPHGDPQQRRRDREVGCGAAAAASDSLCSDASCRLLVSECVYTEIWIMVLTPHLSYWFYLRKFRGETVWKLWSVGGVGVTTYSLHHALQRPVNSELFREAWGERGGGLRLKKV